MEQQIKEYDSLLELIDDLEVKGISGKRKEDIVKRFLFLKARKKEIPFSGGFELTPLCNFDCKMCYVHLTKGQMTKEQELLSADQWIDIMRQACDMGMMYADLTGGECLTYPGFQRVYMYLLSRGVQVSVLTNGSLITDEIIDLFKKYPPEIVQVSLYGSNNDAYERVTGQRAFDTVTAGIHKLKQNGIRVKAAIMPHRFMREDAEALVKSVHSLGIDYALGVVNLPARSNTGRELENYIAESELSAKLRIAVEEINKPTVDEPAQKEEEFWFDVKGSTDQGGIPCASGRCSFHVNWKGELLPCIPFSEVKASVFENGFADAWTLVKRKMKTYRSPGECSTCDMRNECMTCPAEKTFGILNGVLNTSVCDRLRSYLKAKESLIVQKGGLGGEE